MRTRVSEAHRAGRQLATVADMVLAGVTALFVLELLAGVWVLLTADGGTQRWVGGVMILGAPVGWAWLALPCMVARAVGRYIEDRS